MANAFDWSAARAALERLRCALESEPRRAPEDIQNRLHRRIAETERSPAASAGAEGRRSALVFGLAGRRYGADAEHIVEVMPMRHLMLVPGAPAQLLGIVNHRGRAVPVIDILPLLGHGGSGRAEGGFAVVARVRATSFAISAQSVEGVVPVAVSALAPPSAAAGDSPRLTKGTTPDMISVMDLEALAADTRLIVNET